MQDPYFSKLGHGLYVGDSVYSQLPNIFIGNAYTHFLRNILVESSDRRKYIKTWFSFLVLTFELIEI